ncbi:MAG: hypothetical protein V1779_15755 [bacterium]
MKKGLIFILLMVLSGCELWVIGGGPREKVIEINQQSSIGVVYLFKAELDSNNVKGATEVLAMPSGGFFLAIEKYELFEEMERLARIIGQKTITDFKTDTLSETNHKIIVNFDYITEVSFTTSKISDNWYITTYQEQMRWY